MTTRIRFEVRHADARELRRLGKEQLDKALGRHLDGVERRFDIDIEPEVTDNAGNVLLWKGEVSYVG